MAACVACYDVNWTGGYTEPSLVTNIKYMSAFGLI